MDIHAMHNAKFALGTWKRVVKTRPVALILNLFLQVCALFQVKRVFKVNFCQSDIPEAS